MKSIRITGFVRAEEIKDMEDALALDNVRIRQKHRQGNPRPAGVRKQTGDKEERHEWSRTR